MAVGHGKISLEYTNTNTTLGSAVKTFKPHDNIMILTAYSFSVPFSSLPVILSSVARVLIPKRESDYVSPCLKSFGSVLCDVPCQDHVLV